METQLKADFEHASRHLEEAPELVAGTSPELKLKLYGLYKQATCGDCSEAAPSIFNVKARLKHDAWISQHGLSKEDAYRSYIRKVTELDPSIRFPSHKRKSTGSGLSTGNSHSASTSSLAALVKSDSRDFLDRLLGAPPRLMSPGSEASSTFRTEDGEDKSSNGSYRGRPVQKLSSSLRKNISVDELRRMANDEPGSSGSSAITNSAPATPQGMTSASSAMRRSSSLTWGKAEDYTPLLNESRIVRRRDGRTDVEIEDEDVDDAEIEQDEEDDEDATDNGWDTDEDGFRGNGRFYVDSDDEDGGVITDSDEDSEDEYGESRMKGRRDDGRSDRGSETLFETLFFSLPFIVVLNIYKMISSIVFLPITTTVRLLGFKVDKAPETISVREKKQAASMLLFASILPMTPIMYIWMFFFLIFPFTTLPTAAYIAWMLWWDQSPRDGSRKPILRDVPLAKYFIDYFPITLSRKSAPLDPEKKYVFAYHPHGIIGLGSIGAFATHAAGFKDKFPGIDLRLLTLDNNFKVPIIREILLGFGICSCSKKSCHAILDRGPGSAICLVVGGAAESLETERGTYRLVLGRKGFIQVAIENNAELVPVIAFGETDAFETFSAKPGTILREIQVFIQRKLKFTVPIFWGRGMFNNNFGMMPKRRPIHVVTGEPLSLKPFRDRGLEGQDLIEAVHRAYIAALRRLFDENKDECEAGIMRKESLTIIK